MFMARNVALSNDAYEMLERLKRPGESFSDVVKRVVEKPSRPDWKDSIGALKGDKEAEEIFDKILKERHVIRKRRELKW